MKTRFIILAFGLFFLQQTFAQTETLSIDMVLVKGGSYTIGAKSGNTGFDEWLEKHQGLCHQVTLSDFYIGKYEITQAQWKAVMGTNPSRFRGDSLPVEQVTWGQVQKFIQKLNEKTGENYRLPTEAEWEYAARGGANGGGCNYSGARPKGYVPGQWELQNTPCARIQQCACLKNETCPVGSYWPNGLGIYDMTWNVMEWCSDWFALYTSEAVVNPKGPESGTERVFRGGEMSSEPRDTWKTYITWRSHDTPDYVDAHLGFRLAKNNN